MKTKTGSKVSLRILIAFVAVVMVFSTVLGSLGTTASAESSVFKRNDSIVSDYTSFLNSSVVQRLPENVKDDEVISVIVNLGTPTLMDAYNKTDKKLSFAEYLLTDEAEAQKADILSAKQSYLNELTRCSIPYTSGAEYTNVLSGFEVLFEARYFDRACGLLDSSATAIVGEVYNVAETQLVENKVTVNEDTGIFDTTSFKYDGSGMVVAVLDTGLDYTHPAFSPSYFTSNTLGLTKDEVASKVNGTAAAVRVPGLTADDVYINNKVPFSFDYADNDADVYSLHNNHGTHVSGVIVGNDGPDGQLRGAAPNAQLVSMKIFSDILESARASWILSALEDCVALGVDVINMSLGTACGFSREIDKMEMAKVYDAIREQGISMVVAASNSFTSTHGSEKNGNLTLTSNPDIGTVGSPSTYPGAISIASINGEKTPYILDDDGNIIYFVESSDAAGEEKLFFQDLLNGDKNKTLELEYVLIPGVGNESNYLGIDVKDKIALVRRGENTFEEKAYAAKAAGARALIVYNNTSGDIRMNVGVIDRDGVFPVCSISQDDGEKLAAAKSGKLKFSYSQASGPFMSDFSSWGPSPSLEIKPEITAHGGNILSAVTGHGYDRLSGTSMACPNMSGVIALLRQFVIDEFKDRVGEGDNINYVEVNSIVNRLLMSTADIVYNKNGLPYAVRKQGAGLANLDEAALTKAYILTYKDGEVMDKSKIELGDDPNKTGVYTFKFTIDNFGSSALSYNIDATVMTEGVSDTPTYKGDTVVTGEGYLLTGAKVEIISVTGGTKQGSTVTVNGGSKCDVEMKITLSDADKKYLDDSFENGMYIEGFVTLKAKDEGSTDLNVPYLAFYGNWNQAPLFDIDYFETNADELNDSIATLDKVLPDAYATRPIGGVSDDYISYLGSYYFVQNPANKIISAKREYIAISNVEGTVHSLRFVWGGQLRNAEEIYITITDDATGEVIFEKTEVSVRKSYGDGGSYIYPTSIEIEFDAKEHNLKNNAKYTVKLLGVLEYGDGGIEDNLKNTFEFPLTIDFEAPTLTGCEFYTEYDKDAEKTRLFAKMAVYDNHYAMGMQIGYVGTTTQYNPDTQQDEAVNMLYPFENYITPIYSVENGTTYVTFELTDHIYDIKNNSMNKNSFAVSLYDYAINEATYEIALPDDFAQFYLHDYTVDGEDLKLNVNEVYTITDNVTVYPEGEWSELLEFSVPNNGVLRVVNNKVVALKSGASVINISYKDENGNELKRGRMFVTVLGTDDDGYKKISKPVADIFEVTGYDTVNAFYVMSTEDRDIGEVGDKIIFSGDNYNVSMYPSEQIKLNCKLDAYFPADTEIVYSSSNKKVTIDENGLITAVEKGRANITVSVKMDGKSTFLSETIRIEVKDPYVRTGPTLNNYYGAGDQNSGLVIIPSNMMFTQIGQYAFSNFNYIPKDLEAGDVIDEEEPDATKIAFIGNDDIKKVVIPEGVETIGPYAFAGLTALTEIELPSTLEAIEYGAFFGCTSLKTVKGLENVKLINKYAFQNCAIETPLTLTSIHAIGDYAFAGNEELESISFGKSLSSIGAYAFADNKSLTTFDTSLCGNIKYGPYVLMGSTSIEEIAMNTSVIPAGAFYNCAKLKKVSIGKDVSTIGEYAFSGTALTSFDVVDGNTAYKTLNGKGYLLNLDGDTLLMVAPGLDGIFTSEGDSALAGVTKIGYAAFSGNKGITRVVMPAVTYVDSYAFSEARALESYELGTLTNIGDYAFFLTDITELPSFESVSSIGKYAFAFTFIEEVNIKDGLTVGEGAFAECTKLKKVTVGDGATLGDGAFMRGATREDPRSPGNYLNIGSTAIKDIVSGFYFMEYLSSLKEIAVGSNVEIGKFAFMGAASIENITLGDEGITIGEMAFYNCNNLKSINLGGVKRIGKLAFSGDNNYLLFDASGSDYVVKDDLYVFYYYSPKLVSIDLSGLEADGLDEQAFMFCKYLTSVTLGEGLKTIPYMAFSNCNKLASINLDNVTFIGNAAFAESSITSVNLSSAEYIDEYAFTRCEKLTSVSLNEAGTDIGEGAFSYCNSLTTVTNLGSSEEIGDYAFAYAGITSADLTNAVHVGDQAFMKETMTDYTFAVTFGDKLVSLGDNPFAMCKLDAFYKVQDIEWNGMTVGTETVYTFDITPTVKVINGSVYTVVPYGLELTVYVGLDENGKSLDRMNVMLDESTVRVSAMAFAGSDVVKVTLPHALNSIGHKAFYGCDKLTTVVFESYTAPKLEEEYDEEYYTSFENLPLTGEYDISYYVDKNGDGRIDDETETVTYTGLGVVPFYMWNLTDSKYSNVFYGANFVDYVGRNDKSLVMVAPFNGKQYDSFIFAQYFGDFVEGGISAEDTTLAAIEAINKIPSKITLNDEQIIIDARAAYSKVVDALQKTLVTNYDKLTRAEKLIESYKNNSGTTTPVPPVDNDPVTPPADTSENKLMHTVIIAEAAVILVIIIVLIVLAVLKDRSEIYSEYLRRKVKGYQSKK